MEVCGVRVVDLPAYEIASDETAGKGRKMLQVETGETVGGGLRRGLLQHKPHPMQFRESVGLFFDPADYFETVSQGLVGLVQLTSFPDLDKLVESGHPDEIIGIGHPEKGGAVAVRSQHGQRSRVSQSEELLDEFAFLEMGLCGKGHQLVKEGEETCSHRHRPDNPNGEGSG